MKADILKGEALFIIVGAVVAAYALHKAWGVGKGIVTNDNALTRGATDASGTPTTAYLDSPVPVLGTVGAAANAASGGYLASGGDWLGSKLFDLFNPHAGGLDAPANPAPPSSSATLDKFNQAGNAPSGSGSLDIFSDPEGWGAQYGS